MDYLFLEKIILFGVILLQCLIASRCLKKILNFGGIFDTGIFLEPYILNRVGQKIPIAKKDYLGEFNPETKFIVSLVSANKENPILTRIMNSINNYLINNYGAAVNFGIIQDMLEREIDAADEEISNLISAPLYLGLAATMIGIVLGLLSMPNIESGNFSEAINSLITGVKLAMIASLIGLVLTTILSVWLYRAQKNFLLLQKHELISYLQAELLPELIKAEESGLSGLKQSLDRFARFAKTIVDHVDVGIRQTSDNLRVQNEVLQRVEKMNISRISKANVELLDNLERNLDAFRNFSKDMRHIQEISSNLAAFSDKTTDIDAIAEEIRNNIREVNRLNDYLTQHFEKLESHGNNALKAVDLSDAHFNESINRLTEHFKNNRSTFINTTNEFELQIKQIYTEISDNLIEMSKNQMSRFREIYDENTPKFNHLEKLSELTEIKDVLIKHTKELQRINNQPIAKSPGHNGSPPSPPSPPKEIKSTWGKIVDFFNQP